MIFEDLGQLGYRAAWDYQIQTHDKVLAGEEERVLLVEHPPVITLGRRPGVVRNLLASEQQLAQMGVEVVESDRGGDITFHGPGQLVVYPIIRLNDHKLSVGGYVHRLEEIVIDALTHLGVNGAKADREAPGVWVNNPQGQLAKVCAVGVRIRRGVSMHGIALNVMTDLNYFGLIVPCGLTGRAVTTLHQLLGPAAPGMPLVKQQMTDAFRRGFCRDK